MKVRNLVLLLAMLLFFRANSHSQDKKVAILECVDKVGDVKYGHRMMLRTNLTNAINKTQGYQAIARLNLSSIIDEQKFQRSGKVSDQQIKKIGELNGATHVLIAEVANYSSTEVVVNAQLINVETGQIENTSEGIPVDFVDAQKMKSACNEIAAQLLGIENGDGDFVVMFNKAITFAMPKEGYELSKDAKKKIYAVAIFIANHHKSVTKVCIIGHCSDRTTNKLMWNKKSQLYAETVLGYISDYCEDAGSPLKWDEIELRWTGIREGNKDGVMIYVCNGKLEDKQIEEDYYDSVDWKDMYN